MTKLDLPTPYRFRACILELERALASDDRAAVARATERLVGGLCQVFSVPRLSVRVLAVRPSRGGGELHGLYEATEGRRAVITVWMRTAKLKNVVAFRTFLRTVVHEVAHHLDYALLQLPDSFHTQGFYQRESGLTRALLEERARE